MVKQQQREAIPGQVQPAGDLAHAHAKVGSSNTPLSLIETTKFPDSSESKRNLIEQEIEEQKLIGRTAGRRSQVH